MAKTLDTLTVQMVDGKPTLSAIYIATITDPFTGETSVVRSQPMRLTDANAPEFKAALGDVAVAATARADAAESLLAAQMDAQRGAEETIVALRTEVQDITAQRDAIQQHADAFDEERASLQNRISDLEQAAQESAQNLQHAEQLMRDTLNRAETAAAAHVRAIDEAGVRYASLQGMLTNAQRSEDQLRSANATLRVNERAAIDARVQAEYQRDVLQAKLDGTPIPTPPAPQEAQQPAPLE